METTEILDGKNILLVDDEPDILESLEDLLEMCALESASDFETAKGLLETKPYDAAILDIMGVDGYELLKIANEKSIPAIMLTGHALTVDNFFKSVREGAKAYLPKDKLSEIDVFLGDVLGEEKPDEKDNKPGSWFDRLKSYYDKKFGSGWDEDHKGRF